MNPLEEYQRKPAYVDQERPLDPFRRLLGDEGAAQVATLALQEGASLHYWAKVLVMVKIGRWAMNLVVSSGGIYDLYQYLNSLLPPERAFARKLLILYLELRSRLLRDQVGGSDSEADMERMEDLAEFLLFVP